MKEETFRNQLKYTLLPLTGWSVGSKLIESAEIERQSLGKEHGRALSDQAFHHGHGMVHPASVQSTKGEVVQARSDQRWPGPTTTLRSETDGRTIGRIGLGTPEDVGGKSK